MEKCNTCERLLEKLIIIGWIRFLEIKLILDCNAEEDAVMLYISKLWRRTPLSTQDA
jgi:hypothetical protein